MIRGARKDGLSRRHRFVGRGSFSAALQGSNKFRGSGMVLHVAAGRLGTSRFGIAVAKRLARRSVDRSRLKRLAREAFRRHAVKWAGLDLVLALRRPFTREQDEAGWVAELNGLLARAGEGR
jgi:ribonuclease P protein component